MPPASEFSGSWLLFAKSGRVTSVPGPAAAVSHTPHAPAVISNLSHLPFPSTDSTERKVIKSLLFPDSPVLLPLRLFHVIGTTNVARITPRTILVIAATNALVAH